MMFYIYALVIPLLILLANYYVASSKPKKVSEYVNLFLRTLPHELGYMFFLYYVEREQNIHTGGADLALFIFLIPITAILLLLYIFYLIKRSLKYQKAYTLFKEYFLFEILLSYFLMLAQCSNPDMAKKRRESENLKINYQLLNRYAQ